MKKKFMKNLPNKVFFTLVTLIVAFFDSEFQASIWAQIIAVVFIILIFCGEIIWDFLGKVSGRSD